MNSRLNYKLKERKLMKLDQKHMKIKVKCKLDMINHKKNLNKLDKRISIYKKKRVNGH
jgi:hypothetical protein